MILALILICGNALAATPTPSPTPSPSPAPTISGTCHGFQKTVSLPTGVSGNYIKIMNVRLDESKLTATYQLGLYLNQTAAATAQPLKTYSIQLNLNSAQASGNLSQIGYQLILNYIYANVYNAANPFFLNKSLVSDLSGATPI